ncbi:MAG: glycosyltransferase family 4 protein [Richelia sp. RM2_1_2]|nr:glycosyltransferase family 4 protein [Richelia sp. SM1_7_0]NJN11343.1 glycosyltransferase family 4 protein [Richelia sp. RM1_1_1]NJO30078.1 glycosyltransferase family 4 protein [Richelia sp. SL_2_1]NJO61771.1 glycosyltransferase family 4 protein [Richelia sp. RM2_1_2]
MRIAYLTGEYPRATDTFIQREVAALRQQGVEVHTFSVRPTGEEHMVGEEQKQERNQTFYILPPHPIKLLQAHLNLLLASPKRYLTALKLAWLTRLHGLKGNLYQLFYFLEAGILAQEIKQRQIPHLHNHFGDSSCTVAMLAAELAGFSYSFTLHGPYIFFQPYYWRLDEKINRALFVSCISNYCRSQGMIFAPIDKWNQMHIIHCGIEPALFKVVSHHGQGKRLLYVGRLAAVKGLPILLQSLVSLKQQHPNVILTVVGDGSDRTSLEQMTVDLGLSSNVIFVGYKNQAEVRKYFEETDVFVLSSFAEGVPVVLMEAMAAGVPVVAPQIAGVSELVENGVSGYIVPAGDKNSLANSIEKLLNDGELRAKFGTAGRNKVETEFNINLEAEKLYKIMSKALQPVDS